MLRTTAIDLGLAGQQRNKPAPAPFQSGKSVGLGQVIDELGENGVRSRLINVPPFAFEPDAWTMAMQRGLAKCQNDLHGKSILEVGVGTGINPIFLLLLQPGIKQVLGGDLDPRLAPLARRNVDQVLEPKIAKKFTALSGVRNLLNDPSDIPDLDVVIGCVPQVAKVNGSKVVADHDAHYYDPKDHPSDFNPQHLGLNHTLLRQAQSALPRGGMVVLNLAGRPGFPIISRMFNESNFTCQILHQEVIAQHAGTDLSPLAQTENDIASGKAANSFGFTTFEFFADCAAQKPIDARTAHTTKLNGGTVFHKIYVVKGIKH